MIYSYELNKRFTIEKINNTEVNTWFIYQLQKPEELISKLDRTSFKRTKNWLKKNYPELLI
jgi:hypothetical protein